MTTVDFIAIVCCAVIFWFAWDCWRDLAELKQELERRKRGRVIRARVLAEVAKQRMVQP